MSASSVETDSAAPLVLQEEEELRTAVDRSATAQVGRGDNNRAAYSDYYSQLGQGVLEEEEDVEESLRVRRPPPQRPISPASSTQNDLETSLLTYPNDVYARNEDDSAEIVARQRRVQQKAFVFVIATSTVFILAIFIWFLAGGSHGKDHRLDFVPAQSYEVSFVTTLSSGLEEPGIAMVDQTTQKMRVSYYSGMTTYILDPKGPSWSIVPRVDQFVCFKEHDGVELQTIFPDTKRFKLTKKVELEMKQRGANSSLEKKKKKAQNNKVKCNQWVYRVENKANGGYLGTYYLWTKEGSNVPLRFSFFGQNVIFGTSHYDNYTIDYYNYRELSNEGGVDPLWLQPPKGMFCRNVSTSTVGSSSLARRHVAVTKLLFPEYENEREGEYEQFVRMFSVKDRSPERSVIFHQTLRLIEIHNRNPSVMYKLRLNPLADRTTEERRSIFQGTLKSHKGLLPKTECKIELLGKLLNESRTVTLPDEIDYVDAGLTHPPGDQGTCGSAWAFAVTGVIEGQMAKNSQKPPVKLSEQNLLDCAWINPSESLACRGGLDYTSYAWIIQNEGKIATDQSYPFLGQDGFCHFDLKRKLVSDGAHAQEDAPKVTDCFHVSGAFRANASTFEERFKPEDLMRAFNMRLYTVGPLSVSIDASLDDFYFYSSGIYSNPNCKSTPVDLDHIVLAVGADFTGPVPYTRIRNNWGMWGEGGYARIAQKNNICGVATAATYVVVG